MTGYIYAIGSENGTVKIGYSVNPKSRLPFLRVGHPGKLTLLGFIEATRSQEAEVHHLLARWRVTGEWFRLEGAVKDFVEMLPKPPSPPPRASGPGSRVVAQHEQYRIAREIAAGRREPYPLPLKRSRE